MSKANRYTFKAVPGHDGQVERQNITGEFALWRAYEDLENEAKALREEVAAYRADPSYDMACATIRRLNEELAALRARVVVPEGYALVPIELTRDMWVAVNKEDDKAYAGACDHGAQFDWLWEAAIEAAPRLNSKAVSEGLLRRVTADADPEEVFTSDRGEALTELLDLLGEGKEP